MQIQTNRALLLQNYVVFNHYFSSSIDCHLQTTKVVVVKKFVLWILKRLHRKILMKISKQKRVIRYHMVNKYPIDVVQKHIVDCSTFKMSKIHNQFFRTYFPGSISQGLLLLTNISGPNSQDQFLRVNLLFHFVKKVFYNRKRTHWG